MTRGKFLQAPILQSSTGYTQNILIEGESDSFYQILPAQEGIYGESVSVQLCDNTCGTDSNNEEPIIYKGSSGTSGSSSTSGTSGTSGSSGTSGTSGINGSSGIDGTSGTSG